MSRDRDRPADAFSRAGRERGPMPMPDASSRCFEIRWPDAGAPPLVLVADRPLSARAIANVREAVRLAAEPRTPILIVDGDFTLFQAIDGRWQPLKATP